MILLLTPDADLKNTYGGMGELTRHLSTIDNLEIADIEYPQMDFTTSPFLQMIEIQSYQAAKLIDDYKENPPQKIIAFDWSTGIIGITLSRYFNIPLIYSTQLSPYQMELDINNDANKETKIVGMIEDHIMSVATICVHVSQDYFNRWPLWSFKSVIIPNCVDETKILEKQESDKKIILYIGRHHPMKGLHHFANCDIPDGWELQIAGDSIGGRHSYYFQAKEFLQKKPNVKYIGKLSGAEKWQKLADCECVVIPSMHEPFGIVGLEAMINKKPIITTAANGLKEFIPENGMLKFDCQPGCQLKDKIIEFINLSEEQKNEMGAINYLKAKEFGVERFLHSYMTIINGVI